MLALTLAALSLLQQGPADAMAASVPAGISVVGTIELSEADALAAATRCAEDAVRERQIEHAQQIASREAPFWLPSFVAGRVTSDWLRCRRGPMKVLTSRTTERQYSYGKAYVAEMVVADPNADRAGASSLARQLRRAGKLFLAKCGGLAVLFGLLAFLSSWFDRLSRGYMTWRLRLLALALGVVATPIALLI